MVYVFLRLQLWPQLVAFLFLNLFVADLFLCGCGEWQLVGTTDIIIIFKNCMSNYDGCSIINCGKLSS